jgi:predicted ATPase
MITDIHIENFKLFQSIDFSLDSTTTVLVGPNNSGKSSIFQALTLWYTGLIRWYSKKGGKNLKKRTGIHINRKDLLYTPVTNVKDLWYNRQVQKGNKNGGSEKIKIRIIVCGKALNGETVNKWKCGIEFDYVSNEILLCRPMMDDGGNLLLDENALNTTIAYLQPMSGLSIMEDKLTPGSIDRNLGMGKTADVLRNICYQLYNPDRDQTINDLAQIPPDAWSQLNNNLYNLFGVEIHIPEFDPATGLIELSYQELGRTLDIANAGRGLQQVLLLLAYMYSHPGSLIMMDEPDAHLEVIRQHEVFNLICDVADSINSQLLVASHSEVVFNIAGETAKLTGIIEHQVLPLNDDNQISKTVQSSLLDIGWQHYFYARTKGYVIYLEGETDYRMLQAFATLLKHPIKAYFDDGAHCYYIKSNEPRYAINNFQTLKGAFPDLIGIAIFDSLPKGPPEKMPKGFQVLTWSKRELENYFAFPQTLKGYVENIKDENLFFQNIENAMDSIIQDLTPPKALRNLDDPFWHEEKLSESYLPRIFNTLSNKYESVRPLNKGEYYKLIPSMPADTVEPEVREKLDALYEVVAGTPAR